MLRTKRSDPQLSRSQLATAAETTGVVDPFENSADDTQALASSPNAGNWPMFARVDSDLEYEYHSESPSVDSEALDPVSNTQYSPPATEVQAAFSTARSTLNPRGTHKSSSRIAFQASLGAQAYR